MFFSLVLGLALAEEDTKQTEETEEEATIASETEDFENYEGLFQLYHDPETGKTKMVVREDQLNQEFIYFAQTRNGVLDAWQFKGSYKGSSVFTIQKSYDRIEFIEQNTSYYFNPENAISKAKDSNISPSVLASLEIIAAEEDEKGAMTYLIDIDSLFLKETFLQIKPSYGTNYNNAFRLGSLSAEKTKFEDIINYEDNTDFVVTYVFEDSHPSGWSTEAVTDPRNVSIEMHHSLIAMPENDFEPRMDDFRIGYFKQTVTDLTSVDPAPYRDMINRWHLAKKDPTAAISDPVEPIVWWIENTTPKEFRQAVKEGVEAWNIAFEAAGFSNAIVVKEQADDATWDAGDINHNVLRWTSSPIPPFGGYGPSFANPRTGQLLGADIMLEFVYVKNRVRYEELYQPSQASQHQEDLLKIDSHFCDFGKHLQDNFMLGAAVLEAQGAAEVEITELINQTIKHLVLHEVGHTLGLNHNMKASQIVPLDRLHDLEFANQYGLVGSVMDYTPINLSPKGEAQGKYFSDRPGTYDLWAIQFGYQPDLSAEERNTLLRRSLEPMLTFGNDADDMRAPGWGIDPRVNIGDLSNDVIGWSENRLIVVDEVLADLKDRYTKQDESFQGLVNAYSILLREKGYLASLASRYVGGVYVERAAADQFTDFAPYTPVPLSEQKHAMKFIAENYWAPDSFAKETELANYLQPQRRGYNFFAYTEDPKLHRSILFIQMAPIYHLLHPQTLDRLTDSKLYGNKYSVTNLFDDITMAVFRGDTFGDVNPHRQLLQTELTNFYIEILEDKYGQYSSISKAAATRSLKQIQALMGFSFGGDADSQAHRHALYLKTRGLWR